jgi:hypothetical protein
MSVSTKFAAVEVAYRASQDAHFAWTVAYAEHAPDADALHAVYAAAWATYLELLTAASQQARAQQASGEGTR